MYETANPAAARRKVVAGPALCLALCLVLSLTSGCFCTAGMWGWAVQRRPRSKVVGVARSSEGEDVVILSLRKSPDLPDAHYALKIPADWRDQSVRRSIWGSEVREIVRPATTLVPVGEAVAYLPAEPEPAPPEPVTEPGPAPAESREPPAPEEPSATDAAEVIEMPARSEMTRMRRLKFPAVTGGWGPWYGGDYGVIYIRDEGRFSAEIFGYVVSRGEWVRLGGVKLDPGRASAWRTAVAVVSTPGTLIADFFAGMVYIRASMEGEDIWPRYESYLPRFCDQLDFGGPQRRVMVAEQVRRYDERAKVVVPALRRALADGDGAVDEIAVTLRKLCPDDPDFYVPGLIVAVGTGTPDGREGAARLLGAWRVKEAVPALIDALGQDDEPDVRCAAATALGVMGPIAREAVLPLGAALKDGSWTVRRAAARALGVMGTCAWRAVPALEAALEDESWEVRHAVKKTLRSIGDNVSHVFLSDAFSELGPDVTSPVAALPLSNVTADMDYPPLVRSYLAPALRGKGYKVTSCEDCDAKLRADGITQGGQLRAVDPETLGSILGVDFAVYGNVESAGVEIRLPLPVKRFATSFSMVHTPDGEPLWGATGHGVMRLPCSVESCIERAVANALSTLPGPRSLDGAAGSEEEGPEDPLSRARPERIDDRAAANIFSAALRRQKSEKNPTNRIAILEETLRDLVGTRYEKKIEAMIGFERRRAERRRR